METYQKIVKRKENVGIIEHYFARKKEQPVNPYLAPHTK